MVVVFGSINVDLLFRLPALPGPGQTLRADTMAVQPGGKGANQAVAARLDGAAVAMVGAVGDDALAAVATAGLRRCGVDLALVRTVPGLATGCASVCTDAGGRNQIAVAAGANGRVRAEWLPDALLRPGTTLLVQGETDPAETASAIARGAAAGCRVVLNLAPAWAAGADTLRRVGLLVVNEDEAGFLGAALGCGAAAAALHRVLGGTVVRTLGAAGAEAAGPDGAVRVPGTAVRAVDTTAAGDCFVGVMAAALDRGAGLEAAMRRGCAAAALACTREGSQGSLPQAAEIDRLMG